MPGIILDLRSGKMAGWIEQQSITSSPPNLVVRNRWNVSRICTKDGHISKEDFAATLRGIKAAIDATKSPQREAAYAFYKAYNGK